MSLTTRVLALTFLCSLLLAACELGQPASADLSATATAGATKSGAQASDGSIATSTPIAITAVPAAPVAQVPTSAARSLVGPEWTLLYTGDLNGDSKADVVGVKLAQGVTPDATFRQPGYSAYKGPASEMVIVQAGDGGAPQIMVALAGGALNAGGGVAASFSNASGYMINVTPGSRPLITIWAINQAGAPIGRAAGLEWSAAQGAYVSFGGLAK